MSGLFARIAFPHYVALVLLGYRLCPVLCRPCVPGTSGFRSSFRLFWWTRCAGFRPTITTGEFVEKVAKLHFPALGGHSGTTVRQFQPSCDVTTYTVDPSAVASRCIDSRALGGKLKLRMRSQTRVTKPKAWTLRVSLKSSLDRVPQKREMFWGVLLGPGGCCCCVSGPGAFFVVVRFSLLRLGFFLASSLCFKRKGGDPGTDQLFLEDPADGHRPENRNSFRYPQRLRRTSTAKCSLKVSS